MTMREATQSEWQVKPFWWHHIHNGRVCARQGTAIKQHPKIRILAFNHSRTSEGLDVKYNYRLEVRRAL